VLRALSIANGEESPDSHRSKSNEGAYRPRAASALRLRPLGTTTGLTPSRVPVLPGDPRQFSPVGPHLAHRLHCTRSTTSLLVASMVSMAQTNDDGYRPRLWLPIEQPFNNTPKGGGSSGSHASRLVSPAPMCLCTFSRRRAHFPQGNDCSYTYTCLSARPVSFLSGPVLSRCCLFVPCCQHHLLHINLTNHNPRSGFLSPPPSSLPLYQKVLLPVIPRPTQPRSY
jgi:hypothetical protein